MNKYTGLSDFEINKKVAESLLASKFIIDIKYGEKHIFVTDIHANFYPFNPCNNPAAAMPIIIENKIDLTHLVGNTVCAKHKEYWRISKNPYRAGCEVFLMMKDEENEG